MSLLPQIIPCLNNVFRNKLEVLTLSCSVEFCYFARPDSVIDAMKVRQSRENSGYKLVYRTAKALSPSLLEEIDVVMPVQTKVTPQHPM